MSYNKDIKPPKIVHEIGSHHPINNTLDYILTFLESIGFETVDGPEVETEKFNFDMLNIKKTHPARQMHDTFYVNEKSNVLRTHTSPVQIRGMLDENHPSFYIWGQGIQKRR